MIRTSIGESNPSGSEYVDYELSVEDRENIKQIISCLDPSTYADEATIREHTYVLQDMDARIVKALKKERYIGYSNATLQHDSHRIQNLLKRLKTQRTRTETIRAIIERSFPESQYHTIGVS